MCKISFVILHYNNLKDTKKCVNSLKKYLDKFDIEIILVDNGSTKETLKLDAQKNKNPKIHFIISKDNLGFAKGNNLGFKYAKYNLNSDVIILTNSDTWFTQKDFITKLDQDYKDGFDVAGPKILTHNGTYNQNPVPNVYKSIKDIRKRILKLRVLYCASFLNMDNLIHKIFGKKEKDISYQHGDFQLHGACLIFANQYLKMFDGLYSGTFMYSEEDFLKYRVNKYHLKMKYLDNIYVFHKGDSSVKSNYGNGAKKRRFKYRGGIDSLKKLVKVMEME